MCRPTVTHVTQWQWQILLQLRVLDAMPGRHQPLPNKDVLRLVLLEPHQVMARHNCVRGPMQKTVAAEHTAKEIAPATSSATV